ncbi:MAG: hypothetical protein ACKV2V_04880 [Blastocatellia bacterium]
MQPNRPRSVIDNASATTLPILNKSKFSRLEIELPNLIEQAQIVRRVETLFAYADRLDARYQQARAEVDRLTPALLAKAFRGELVPQDPNDEPATVLLERIRAAREAGDDTRPRRAARAAAAAVTQTESVTTTPLDEIAAGLAEIFQPKKPAIENNSAANGHRDTPPDISEIDRETQLFTIRKVFGAGERLMADDAIRAVRESPGYARTGSRIHEHLKNTLRVAVQRGILVNEQGEYRLLTRTIADYDAQECISALLSAMSRAWTTRDEAIRAAARHLGFKRAGSTIEDAFKNAIRTAIRRGLLEADGDVIRKTS